MLISASILTADFSNLEKELKRLEQAKVDMIHLDVMDGNFVPNISFGLPVLNSIKGKTSLPFDVHLMIENPDDYIEKFAATGAEYITVHAETCKHLHRTVSRIKELGVKVGVALNPSTSLETIKYIIDDIDMVLIMTVNPGYGGQKFIPLMEAKIRAVRQLAIASQTSTLIEVDGGMNEKTMKIAYQAGANIAVAGASIFQNGDMDEAVKALRNAFK